VSIDVLSQFVPVEACVLHLRAPDLPHLRVPFGAVGALDDEAVLSAVLRGDPEAASFARLAGCGSATYGFPLVLGGAPLGVLAAAGDIVAHATSFFAAVAEQISLGLTTIVESERLRRQAATAVAMRLATGVTPGSLASQLDELVHALAALPHAVGAAITVEAVTADRASASAGIDAGHADERRVEVEGGGTVTIRVTWGNAPTATNSVVDAVLETLLTSLRQAHDHRRLVDDAETDPLTGVGNRRRAERALAAAVNRADRHQEHVAVMLLDLDDFKSVNDRFGHDAGDEVLRHFTAMLERETRGYDTVARIGGDEFLVVCPTTSRIEADRLAERLRSATRTIVIAEADRWRPSVSIGIAIYPGAASDDLVRTADRALYSAKRDGKDRVVTSS
jgi:diguanylate cyclase (GGDEF)-like protein